MSDPVAPFDALLDLDARHDELLRELEELDHRVQKVLAEYLPVHEPSRQPVANPEIISREPPAAAA
jgi:hypothetical protein